MAATLRLSLAAATLALSALGLAACGDDTPIDRPTATESPDEPTDGGEDTLTEQQARDRIAHFLGVNEERAEEIADDNDWILRVARRGEESFMLTQDYVIGRITVELDSEDAGETWRVTKATVEATDGPVTDELQAS